jgi:hypothetical protein
MAEQETNTAPTYGAITLIVDFSNGVQRIFANLPSQPLSDPMIEHEGMSVIDALDHASARHPGLTYTFERSFVDRGGGDRGHITIVDSVEASGPDQQWPVWVNQTAATDLRRVTAQTMGKRAG